VSSEHDLRPALNTYHGFVNMMKWGTIGVGLIAAFVVFLLSHSAH
jgi:hypothetical protein